MKGTGIVVTAPTWPEWADSSVIQPLEYGYDLQQCDPSRAAGASIVAPGTSRTDGQASLFESFPRIPLDRQSHATRESGLPRRPGSAPRAAYALSQTIGARVEPESRR